MTIIYPEMTDPIVVLEEPHLENIVTFLADHSGCNPYCSASAFEDFVLGASALLPLLPPEVIRELVRFRIHGSREGVLLIRGLPIKDRRIGPTPLHWSLEAQTKKTFETELYLLGCMVLLGEVFSFNTQHLGNVIQNVVPVKDDAYEQVGTGSRVFLDWHIEDAFSDYRADLIGLLCLRANPEAATTFASVRRMQLPEHHKRCLFEKRFLVDIDGAHQRPDGFTERSIAILFGNYEDPFLRLDPLFMRAQANDPEAAAALDYIVKMIPEVARQVVLEQGDLLVMDNHRVIHGRSAYSPRFDGTDRWLQRVSITTDVRKSSEVRRRQFRVIENELCA